ncbi:MAG: hypothetical protein MR293_01560 [Bacteroidales bacterium]|nr:hypothetical protein [Bacteroidales bacterium]
MPKLCLNTRDELAIFDLAQVAYFRAEGNYTAAIYISGTEQVVCMGISSFVRQLSPLYPNGVLPFIRFGRNLLVNTAFVQTISLPQQRLILSDYMEHTLSLSVPRHTLKVCKTLLYAHLHATSSANPTSPNTNLASPHIDQ